MKRLVLAGAGHAQVFRHGVWPAVLPQFVSHHLVWEFKFRDSTIRVLIRAGGRVVLDVPRLTAAPGERVPITGPEMAAQAVSLARITTGRRAQA